MKKKFILPLTAIAMLLGLVVTGCTPASSGEGGGEGGGGGDPVEPPAQEEIKVTAAGNKTELMVGETVQLSANVEGVAWSSTISTVASVDKNGLVTAVAAGTTKIRAKKDGYDTGSITITVTKAPEREAKYHLPLEQAEHYDPDDFWGMVYGGTTYGPGDSPVEDNGGATADGTSLGWLNQGCKETLTFTSDKAVKVEIGVTMAYNADVDLSNTLSVKFNGAAISMAGKVCPGPEDGDTNNYYDFHAVSFGEVTLKAENNVLEMEIIGSTGVNMDEMVVFTEETLALAVIPAVVKQKIVVSPESMSLEVGETEQITSEITGLSYVSSDAAIASVSESGLVTAVAAGKATITVSKDGMKDATVAVTVTAPHETVDYTLVAGETVRLELENGEFSNNNGYWGYPQWGMAPNHDGGVTPIEEQESASGGMSLGYVDNSTKIILKISSPKAGTVSIKLGAAYAREVDLGANFTLKIGENNVDLTGKTVPGSADGQSYYEWAVVDLGTCAVVEGEQLVVLECIGSGANLDYIDLTLA